MFCANRSMDCLIFMHWFFIFDHSIGNKQLIAQQPKLLNRLKQQNIAISYQEADNEQALKNIALQAAERGHKKFIIVGSDQSVNHALQGLYQYTQDLTDFCLGALPWGRRNHWANLHNIPSDIDAFITLLQQESFVTHDIGLAKYTDKQHVFIDHLSLGISSHVLKQLPANYSNWRYWWTLLSVLRSYRPQTASCSEPKIEQRRALIMIASLASYMGEGSNTDSTSYDGLLDVLTVENAPLIQRVKALLAAHKGTLKQQPISRHAKLNNITFDLRGDIVFECDGVPIAAPPVEVTCIAQAIQVLSLQQKPLAKVE